MPKNPNARPTSLLPDPRSERLLRQRIADPPISTARYFCALVVYSPGWHLVAVHFSQTKILLVGFHMVIYRNE